MSLTSDAAPPDSFTGGRLYLGLNLGGLNFEQVVDDFSLSSTCDAWIICSKMARVGEKYSSLLLLLLLDKD